MGIVPRKKVERLQFFTQHLVPWATNTAAVGLVAGDLTALEDACSAAADALNAQIAAASGAKAATLASDNAFDALGTLGSDLIKKIKAKAATAGDNVYVLAEIPPPSAPSPRAAPGTPTDFTVALLQDGSLELAWKCANPEGTSGTIYEVRRSVAGSGGTLAYVGATGVRSFVDDTLPAGSAAVTYQVTAVRSTRRGNPATFNVNFGVGSGGTMTASVTTAPRIAA